ncbi:MAG: hypothetical protein HY904_14760 [Deltaproteobacteria bacterium]|nr:hypothetical protein [Deltaproteobacteria bacterium]
MARTFHALYLQHGDRRLPEALAAVRRIHECVFPGLERRIVVTDNAVTSGGASPVAADTVLVAGDNTYREFSGWDRGWRWLEEHRAPADDDVLCLCNDTFMADPEAEDFHRLDGATALRDLQAGRLLGHVDGLAADVNVFGTPLRHWIKSNLVLMSVRTLRDLAPLTLTLADEELFVDDPAVFFRDRDDLGRDYREFIKGFLQGRPNAALWRWHSARPFDHDNLALFRLKARAILSEHGLSARAARTGHAIVDISAPRLPSKELRHRLRFELYRTGAWRLVPRFRRRFNV